MNIKKQLGEKIKRIRKKRGLTQEKLSEMIDISPRNLSGIEQGAYFVKADTLEKILSALNVTPEDLFMVDHIKTESELISDIFKMIDDFKEDRQTLEIIYRMVKSLMYR